MHGGASPQAKRAADARVMMLTVAGDEHRTPDEILLDALRLADTAMIMEPNVETMRLAAQLAAEAVKIGVAVRRVESERDQVHRDAAQRMTDALSNVLGTLLDTLVGAEREAWRAWAFSTAARTMRGEPVHTPQGEPIPAPPKRTRAAAALPAATAERFVNGVSVPIPAPGNVAVESGRSAETPESGDGTVDPGVPDGPGRTVHTSDPGPDPADDGVVVSLRDQAAYLRRIGRGQDGPARVIWHPDRPASEPTPEQPNAWGRR